MVLERRRTEQLSVLYLGWHQVNVFVKIQVYILFRFVNSLVPAHSPRPVVLLMIVTLLNKNTKLGRASHKFARIHSRSIFPSSPPSDLYFHRLNLDSAGTRSCPLGAAAAVPGESDCQCNFSFFRTPGSWEESRSNSPGAL